MLGLWGTLLLNSVVCPSCVLDGASLAFQMLLNSLREGSKGLKVPQLHRKHYRKAIWITLHSLEDCSTSRRLTEPMQDGWQGPMDTFTQHQLAAHGRRSHAAAPARPLGAHAGVRRLLTPSRQSALTTWGSGLLEYRPVGYSIDGADLSQFFLEAHANLNVTGERSPPVKCLCGRTQFS